MPRAVLARTRTVALEQRVVRYLQQHEARQRRSTRAIAKSLWRDAHSREIRQTLENLRSTGRVQHEEYRTERGQQTDCWTLITEERLASRLGFDGRIRGSHHIFTKEGMVALFQSLPPRSRTWQEWKERRFEDFFRHA